MRSYPDFEPLPTTGVRRTEAQWAEYEADIERRKIATARQADAMNARWQANSEAYFERRRRMLDQASAAE